MTVVGSQPVERGRATTLSDTATGVVQPGPGLRPVNAPRRQPPDGLLGVLIAVLAGTPRLDGARCRDLPDVFAETETRDGHRGEKPSPAAVAAALGECQRCPALTECRAWVQSLPLARRPTGVVAGLRINENRRISKKHQPHQRPEYHCRTNQPTERNGTMSTNPSTEGTPSGAPWNPRHLQNASLAGRLTAAVAADHGPGVTALLAQIRDADTEGVLLAIAALAASLAGSNERGQKFLDEYAMAALDANEQGGNHDADTE